MPSVTKRRRVRGPIFFFEANLVANGFANVFADFPCDATRGHAGGDVARFQHNDFAADAAAEDCGCGTRVVFPAPGGASMTRLGVRKQGCEDLRQNRVYRKCWLSESLR